VSLSSPSGVVMGESAMAEGDERRGEESSTIGWQPALRGKRRR
jgi:hypothetical protein